MQFSIHSKPSTWDRYGLDGNHNGHTSPYEPPTPSPPPPATCALAAPRADYHAALFAYNHADWYVAEVLANAATCRGAGTGGSPPAHRHDWPVLRDPRIVLTPLQRADLCGGLIDPRLVSALATIAQRHTGVITALRSDHSTYTADGNVSNHSAGRAMDIGAVDGETCGGTRTGACAEPCTRTREGRGTIARTELIYCWDDDGPTDPGGFARADHCDHIHWGLDGWA